MGNTAAVALHARVFATLALLSIVAGCGSGDRDVGMASGPAQQQDASVPQFASDAPNLPAPTSAEPPQVVGQLPGPPTDVARSSAVVALRLDGEKASSDLFPSIKRETLVAGLKRPTSLAVSAEGDLFFTEGDGELFVRQRGGATTKLISKNEASVDQEEFLAVTLDGEFLQNRTAYVLSRSYSSKAETYRVLRVRMSRGLGKAEEVHDVFKVSEGIDKADRRSSRHFGALLAEGRNLYVSIEASRRPSVREATTTIYRLDTGTLSSGGNSPDATVGIVQAQVVGLSVEPYARTLIVAQRGRQGADQVAGLLGPATDGSSIRWNYKNGEGGLTGIDVLRGSMWRDWENAFVVSFDEGRRLEAVKTNRSGAVLKSQKALDRLGTGFRAIRGGPDGVYLITSGKRGGEEIWRLFTL